MAKNTGKAMSDEPTSTDIDFSALDAGVAQRLTEVDPLENIPCFVPGKAGFETGKKLAGEYIGTKRVYSDKFTAGKKEEDGRIYRDLHIMRNTVHNKKFGIWSVGTLGLVMSRIAPGQLLSVEYTGLAAKSLKPGQSAPHTFKFLGDNLNLDSVTMDEAQDRNDERLENEARV